MKGLSRHRRRAARDARIIVLALEGELSGEEFRYFNWLRARLVNDHRFFVELLPTPSDTHQSSPDAVIRRLDDHVSVHDLQPEIDLLWLVFDIDTWPPAMRSRVAQLATQKHYGLGISNPCFELWLLLHCDDVELEVIAWPENARERSREAKRLLSLHRQHQQHGRQESTLEALHQATVRAEQLMTATPAGQRWPSFPGTHVHAIIADLRNAQLLPEPLSP